MNKYIHVFDFKRKIKRNFNFEILIFFLKTDLTQLTLAKKLKFML